MNRSVPEPRQHPFPGVDVWLSIHSTRSVTRYLTDLPIRADGIPPSWFRSQSFRSETASMAAASRAVRSRTLFRDSQRLMADALGLSPSYLSKVFTGTQPPSHAFLESLARHPMVNRDWLFREEGVPLLPPTAGTLPGAAVILPGPPTGYPDLLDGNRYPVAAALERASVYYLILRPTSPLVREFPLKFRPGDRLAFETAPDFLSRLDAVNSNLCAVRVTPTAQEYVLAVVRVIDGELFARLCDEAEPGADALSPVPGSGPVPALDGTRKLLLEEARKRRHMKDETPEPQEFAEEPPAGRESTSRAPTPAKYPSMRAKGEFGEHAKSPEEEAAKEKQPGQEARATSDDELRPPDTDLLAGWRRLDGTHQVVGIALRLERDGPLCPVHVPERRVRTSQPIETKGEETANRFGELGWPEEPISVREGGWSDEDDREERVRVPESG